MVSTTAEEAKALKTTPYTAAGAKPLYDEWVGTYDDTLKSWGWTPPRLIAEKLTAMGYGDKADTKVLDLGCGTGLSGEKLKEHKIGTYMVGIDISPKSIEHLEKEKPGLYSEGHASNLDEKLTILKDGDFDVAISSGVMSYIENYPNFYGEVIRALKPGAVFCFTQNAQVWDDDSRDCATVADKLVQEGKWKVVSVGEKEDYTPDNPDAEWAARKIRVHVYEKL